MATLTAAAVLAPVAALTPAATASTGTFGPTAFTATAYLPDGQTLASAAVLDLSLPSGVAFARGVSGYDGTVTVDIPETDELVSLALANGGHVQVGWLLSKLFTYRDIPAGRHVAYETLPGTMTEDSPDGVPDQPLIVPNPASAAIYARETGEFVVTLVNETAGRVATLVDRAQDAVLGFHIAEPQIDKIVAKVADIVHAAGVYQDPDLVAGKDDVHDPDLIPPLFVTYQSVPVTDASLYDPRLPSLGETPHTFADETGCTRMETWLLPNGDPNHTAEYGTQYSATLGLSKCTNEGDPYKDYWTWSWAGRVTNVNKTGERVKIWRWKFRTELQYYQQFFWMDDRVDPDENRNAGSDKHADIEWQVNFGFGGIRDKYTILLARKIHPYLDVPDDDPEVERKLYHVSWISGYDDGSEGEWFKNGGAMGFVVPHGTSQATIRQARNTLETWTCLYRWKDNKAVKTCDPH